MPCTDDGYTYKQEQAEVKFHAAKARTAKMVEAMLCALCTSLTNTAVTNPGKTFFQVLKGVDWKEAGVTRSEFDAWWKEHQAKDARRRAESARKAEVAKRVARDNAARAKLQAAAIKKLTSAERKALGV